MPGESKENKRVPVVVATASSSVAHRGRDGRSGPGDRRDHHLGRFPRDGAVDLWKKGVPEKYRGAAPMFPPHKLGEGFQQREGGHDPNARIKEMEVDGLSAEVLYPTLMLKLSRSRTPGSRKPASASTTTG